ncbi:MAG: SAM-dependent chlorinase/fluorinase [Anaerolineae bacterium]|nr:SAM-dependent chlorinase/fluorinase [Anaerolineae bacterium]
MLISLTTDFGLDDGYVGVMKGVISGIAPGAALVDITHAIAPQHVRAAAYVLWTTLPYFPQGSVHLVVVDPGVGTTRRAIASQTPWGTLVGPDNGVFSYVWAAAPPALTVALENPRYQLPATSSTFHGRDIFAPAAAHLAAGVPLSQFGPEVVAPKRLPLPSMQVEEGMVRGEVIHIDRFGNVITSIGRLVWDGALLRLDPAFGAADPLILNPGRVHVRVAGRDLGPVRRTYGEVAAGAPLALVGSEGLLELAVNQGCAARDLGLNLGDGVELAG